MRVLVTGATGYIGAALVADLIQHGHTVPGLARSDDAAAAVEKLGAIPVRGDLEHVEAVAEAARQVDGVAHLAFDSARMMRGDFATAVQLDLAAVTAIGEALTGSGKAFVGTTGSLVVAGLGRTAAEQDVPVPGPRVDTEAHIIGLAQRGVRSASIRVPPIVHDSCLDHHALIAHLIAIAREAGFSGYIGDGSSRLPVVNVHDIAALYRIALESAPPGTRLHASAEEGVPTRDLAEAIGSLLDVPTTSVDPAEAASHFGPAAHMLAASNPLSSARTRQLTGWEPDHLTVVHDIAHYRH